MVGENREMETKKRLELGVGKGTGGGWRKVELCRGPDKKKG